MISIFREAIQDKRNYLDGLNRLVAELEEKGFASGAGSLPPPPRKESTKSDDETHISALETDLALARARLVPFGIHILVL